MVYECDDTNCNVGRAKCQNRPFADLKDRLKAECTESGHAYNIDIETVKTADRGFGLRANRYFKPEHVITEYNGEIIPRDEDDNQADAACYCHYLMDFEQNI